jgi:dUTP pyrophosphatase
MEGRHMDTNQGVLSRQAIAAMLDQQPPLLANLRDRAAQLQPNGVDLTLECVSRLRGPGALGVSNSDRVLPQTEDLAFEPDGSLYLPPGVYQVRFNEVVNLPPWLMAYARPRSSLLRSGAALHTAVWDAGYSGRGVAMLVVYHPAGFRVSRDARICQLVFHRLTGTTDTVYAGVYQGEGRQAAD